MKTSQSLLHQLHLSEIMNQHNDKQRLYSNTKATSTLKSRLTGVFSVEKTMDFSQYDASQYDDQLRYGQYPVQQIVPQFIHDHPWDSSTLPYPGHHRMASYNMSPPMASMDLTEKYYQRSCPTIPFFYNKDPS